MEQKPSIGRIVHYQARGSADGVFPPVPRAAIVTEVGEDPEVIGLTVINPTGVYFYPLAAGGCHYDADGAPGTWCWPPRV